MSLIALALAVALLFGLIVEVLLRVHLILNQPITPSRGRGDSRLSFRDLRTRDAFRCDSNLTRRFWREHLRVADRFSVSDPAGFKRARDFSGRYISVIEGIRRTCNPSESPLRLLVVGGSTVYCAESPDCSTLPSALSQQLAAIGQARHVVNLGVPGVTVSDRRRMLSALDLTQDDTVVVLFGVNEIGHRRQRGRGVLERSVDQFIHQALETVSMYSAVASWAFYEIYPNREKEHDVQSLLHRQTVDELCDIVEECRERGAVCRVVLQPNLFTTTPWLHTHQRVASLYAGDLEQRVSAGYRYFRKHLGSQDWFIDLSGSLSDIRTPIFIDWCHLNSIGNAQLASRIVRALLAEDVELTMPMSLPIDDVARDDESPTRRFLRRCFRRFDRSLGSTAEQSLLYPLF